MSGRPIRIALVGLGKIARDQHLPALAASKAFVLAGSFSPDGASVAGVPSFSSLEALLAADLALDAVAICTPPQVRHDLAAAAIERGVHVFLEKPPTAGLAEAHALAERARVRGVTVFAGWHSRFAAGVAPARAWLAERRVLAATVTWREDVRTWHPRQEWIWRAGGFGVFDPGINALSILTHVVPGRLVLDAAELEFPVNREAPIAARLTLRTNSGAPIAMDLDWRQTGPQTWDIEVETDDGRLRLSRGGAELALPGEIRRGEDREYPALYARFAELVAGGASEVDTEPLRLVADAFARGTALEAAAFHD